jgi:hypothetical protein
MLASSFPVAEDETTWEEVAEEHRAYGAIGPPFWNTALEVKDELMSIEDPKINRACQNLEQPPFGHESRQ